MSEDTQERIAALQSVLIERGVAMSAQELIERSIATGLACAEWVLDGQTVTITPDHTNPDKFGTLRHRGPVQANAHEFR